VFQFTRSSHISRHTSKQISTNGGNDKWQHDDALFLLVIDLKPKGMAISGRLLGFRAITNAKNA
jgi:hypothetical protein